MGERSVLIVGGGIGGLSTAIALRNEEFDVNVVEIRDDLHSSVLGVGIVQPVNALRALDVLGCAEECIEIGYSTTAWGKVLNEEGEEIRQVPGATIPGSDLPPMNGVTRPQLHEILTRKAIEVGATIEYSKTITELNERPDGVAVTYSDGTENTVDIVVGADGVYSTVREYVYGNDVQPTYTGWGSFRCNVPRKIPGHGEIDRIIIQEGTEGIAGFVPLGPDLAYIFYGTLWERDNRPDPDQIHEVLRECLASFGGMTATVRDNYLTDPEKVVLRPQEWLIAPPPWHKGRIVLIGDAIHAMTPHLGQGAAQAIEDGIVLAECLAGADGHESAFNRYVDRRYERCKLIVESSVKIGELEMNPDAGYDRPALIQRMIEAMVQPI